MLIRTIAMFLNYLKYRFRNWNTIWFRGVPVIYAFPGSEIIINATKNNKVNIFSHPLSNMIGLPQRCIIIAKYGGKIEINEGVCMSGCTLYAMVGITIGKNSNIGSGCKIIDNDFHPLPYSQRYPEEQVDKVKKRAIKIGEGCFVGANSIILKGTTLGNNVVVGAGSVVSGSFPDNVIIAGNPARVIKQNEE